MARAEAFKGRIQLPSLNALQAFEAAARHQSFTRAAAELGVTQTAVSHQVRALEIELGVALFRRSPQRVSLTPEGRAWSAELGAVFERLHDANRKLRQPTQSSRPAVAVSIIPSFASRWLVPRLGRLLLKHTEIDVRISATERLVDFALEPFDLAIRYGAGGYAGLVSHKLAEDAFVVVAAPAIARKRSRFRLRDLGAETLLHDDFPDAWARFFDAAGSELPKNARRTEFTDSGMLVEAAVRGQGVALARWSLVADEIGAGRLRLLFPELPPLATGLAYYLVSPRENLRRKAVSAFRDWVVEEAKGLAFPGATRSS
jgi:LysR family glycine cleavage system transcriptional activator